MDPTGLMALGETVGGAVRCCVSPLDSSGLLERASEMHTSSRNLRSDASSCGRDAEVTSGTHRKCVNGGFLGFGGLLELDVRAMAHNAL